MRKHEFPLNSLTDFKFPTPHEDNFDKFDNNEDIEYDT